MTRGDLKEVRAAADEALRLASKAARVPLKVSMVRPSKTTAKLRPLSEIFAQRREQAMGGAAKILGHVV